MPNKKITAKFETIDMAEFAAHGITNNFKNVANIKIRYKNLPRDHREHSDREGDLSYSPIFPVATAVGSGASFGAPLFAPFAIDMLDDSERVDRDIPEIERTTESRMVIEADERAAKQIASKLRCLGGYEIEVF